MRQKLILKNVTHIDTPRFPMKKKLPSLKTEVAKLNIHKLVPLYVDLSQLSDAVENAVHDKLVTKVNNIDTSDFVLKTKYQTH